MAKLFWPDHMLPDVSAITPAFLQKHGIRALVLDVDNTLTLHGSQVLPEKTAAWLSAMREAGVPMRIVSNNSKERVAPFANAVGLPFVSSGLKPVPYGFRKAQRSFRLPASQIGIVGDQLFTDILGGRLSGMQTILVTPLSSEETGFVRWKRRWEKPILRRYRERNGEN